MLDPQKTHEREALLKRYREIQAELARSSATYAKSRHDCRFRSS